MFIRHISKKLGLSPGELVYLGDQKSENVKISVIEYSKDFLNVTEVPNIAACERLKQSNAVAWINISGVHKTDLIKDLGTYFEVHPLVLEDIVNTEQRPKMDDLDTYVFMVMKMVYPDMEAHAIDYEQISFLIGGSYVISLQEVEGDIFDPVRERILKGKGRIRTRGSDYLAYALIDMVVDHYFKVLETIGEEIELLQDDVMQNTDGSPLRSIHSLKSELLFLRKSIWPMREIINALIRGESNLFKDKTVIYLQDVYDHIVQIIETIETFREILSGTLEIYFSNVSNKMNEVMKILTIIATIFIPMTFITGIYGMNFKVMPELNWRWSYPVLWGGLVVLFVIMVIWFKRKKWM
ncbi:MAG: magnesium/cobalt transporter CorA [Deltaproteobacteria bacterium]